MAIRRASKSGISGFKSSFTRAWAPFALGGTVTTAGGYQIHTYSSVGSSTFQILANLSQVEFLLVAGGGGGGTHPSNPAYSYQGGGGAGGYISTSSSVGTNTYPIAVGPGGGSNTNGGPSVFTPVVATGGGRGANGGPGPGQAPAQPGGSGGGAATTQNVGSWSAATNFGTGIPGQGNPGGPQASFPGTGSAQGTGGGGAGGAGLGGPYGNNAKAGGPGLANSITGSPVTYARGGLAVNDGTQGSARPVVNNSGHGGDSRTAGSPGIVVIRYLQ